MKCNSSTGATVSWRPTGFSFSGSTTFVLERPSPASGWISFSSSSGTSVSEPGGPLRSAFGAQRSGGCRGPALGVGARRSGCPGAFCQGPALSMLGPGGLCVEAQRSVSRGPALLVSLWGLALCRGTGRRSLCRRCIRSCHPSGPDPRATQLRRARATHPTPRFDRAPIFIRLHGQAIQLSPDPRARHHSSDPRATHPPLQRHQPGPQSPATHPAPRTPRLRSTCHPSSPARSLFPGENPNLTVGGKIEITI